MGNEIQKAKQGSSALIKYIIDIDHQINQYTNTIDPQLEINTLSHIKLNNVKNSVIQELNSKEKGYLYNRLVFAMKNNYIYDSQYTYDVNVRDSPFLTLSLLLDQISQQQKPQYLMPFLYDSGFEYLHKTLIDEIQNKINFQDYNNITLVMRVLFEVSKHFLLPSNIIKIIIENLDTSSVEVFILSLKITTNLIRLEGFGRVWPSFSAQCNQILQILDESENIIIINEILTILNTFLTNDHEDLMKKYIVTKDCILTLSKIKVSLKSHAYQYQVTQEQNQQIELILDKNQQLVLEFDKQSDLIPMEKQMEIKLSSFQSLFKDNMDSSESSSNSSSDNESKSDNEKEVQIDPKILFHLSNNQCILGNRGKRKLTVDFDKLNIEIPEKALPLIIKCYQQLKSTNNFKQIVGILITFQDKLQEFPPNFLNKFFEILTYKLSNISTQYEETQDVEVQKIAKDFIEKIEILEKELQQSQQTINKQVKEIIQLNSEKQRLNSQIQNLQNLQRMIKESGQTSKQALIAQNLFETGESIKLFQELNKLQLVTIQKIIQDQSKKNISMTQATGKPPPPPLLTPPPAPPIKIGASNNIPAVPPVPKLLISTQQNQSVSKIDAQSSQKQDQSEHHITRHRPQPKQNMKSIPIQFVKQEQVQNTFWTKVDDSKISLQFDILESLFCNVKSESHNNNTNNHRETPVIQIKKQKETLLRQDRSRNIELILSRLKMSIQNIINCLWTCEFQCGEDQVQMIQNALPQEQEIQLYKNQKIEINNYSLGDIFYYELQNIPEFEARVQAQLIRYNFQPQFDKYKEILTFLQDECNLILLTDEIPKILQYCLAVSNFVNKKDSYAIKLDQVEKLWETKSNDGKYSLFMYAIEQAEKNEQKEFINLHYEFNNINKLAQYSIQQISTEINQLNGQILIVKKAIKSQSTQSNDKVAQAYEQDVVKYETFMTQIQILLNESNEKYQQCCNLLFEDPKQLSSKFFNKILRIRSQAIASKQQLVRVRLAQQRLKDKECYLQIQKLQQQQQQQHQGEQIKIKPDEQLLLDIQSGKTELQTRKVSLNSLIDILKKLKNK